MVLRVQEMRTDINSRYKNEDFKGSERGNRGKGWKGDFEFVRGLIFL